MQALLPKCNISMKNEQLCIRTLVEFIKLCIRCRVSNFLDSEFRNNRIMLIAISENELHSWLYDAVISNLSHYDDTEIPFNDDLTDEDRDILVNQFNEFRRYLSGDHVSHSNDFSFFVRIAAAYFAEMIDLEMMETLRFICGEGLLVWSDDANTKEEHQS